MFPAELGLHEFLQILWYLLVAILLLGYFILDGFDLGAGILYPFVAKTEEEKAIVRQSVGPLWDGNEVWLLTGGGALFAAFAPAYATSFSGFYLAIMLVLFGLIFRAIAIEYRGTDTKWRKFWDGAFFIGSFLPALLFGAAIGNIIGGIAIGDTLPLTGGPNLGSDYTGGFFALLNPFALLCAVMGLVAFITQGAAWIALKAPLDSVVRTRAIAARSILHIVELVVFVLVSLVAILFVVPTFAPERVAAVFAYVFAGIFIVGWVVTRLFITKGNDLLSFLGVNVGPIALIGITATSLFPYLIPAADNPSGVFTYFLLPGQDVAEKGLTLFNSGGSELALLAMTIITCIGLPLVLIYHVIIYRTFRGRVKVSEIEY
ncbi:MAG: cytochrome d ubiquinol oxidase subunit II [Coriobacteriales bacterium]|jgi:cytochrome d ubiquinol oxidase subunit II|nr:cytochrome d ubiquinol oxidase subunit II [Coriobacteriales bacterium]